MIVRFNDDVPIVWVASGNRGAKVRKKIAHFVLDFACKESVSGGQRSAPADRLRFRGPQFLSPASAIVPPRGCGGGGAMVRRTWRGANMPNRKTQRRKPRAATKNQSKADAGRCALAAIRDALAAPSARPIRATLALALRASRSNGKGHTAVIMTHNTVLMQ
jgi:hypothetical protein